MKCVLFYHAFTSCWNNGNAHFLRGILRELAARGHEVLALEPAGGWSRSNLEQEQGNLPAERFAQAFPDVTSVSYDAAFDHRAALDDADVVIMHEWTDPRLVAEIGAIRRAGGKFRLLFHDPHHPAVSAHADIAALPLEAYDAVLAFGETLRRRYEALGWGRRAFTWHEAADTTIFRPMPNITAKKDLVFIGNWGDGERTQELVEFLIEPSRRLDLTGTVHGVRYPEAAVALLRGARLHYTGWIANMDAPEVFARHRVTIHVPRRPYVETLPGIPTIRVFEALAAGIPLVSAPWDDIENLFRPGDDFLVARDGTEMTAHLRALVNEPDRAAALAAQGLARIRERHTCAHRVDELFAILAKIDGADLGPQPQGLEAVS
jgi:spore maturation protein CgeB